MKRAIKALVFDAYGTLFDVHSVVSLCDELFPGRGAALSQLWRIKQLEYSWLRSLMGRYESFWRVTESALLFACRALKLTCSPAQRARLMRTYLTLKPFPEVREALTALGDFRLAILSNGTPRMLGAAVKSAGLHGAFAHVISVDGAEIYKPSPDAYELATETLNLEKSAVGFVSSNSFDANGAKAFGFWTCWVNRSDEYPDELGFKADVKVKDLKELADALARSRVGLSSSTSKLRR
jgi:2-haloacid dehalogenase